MYSFPFVFLLSRKYRHPLRGLITMTKRNLIKMASIDLSTFHIFNLNFPAVIFFVAIDHLDACIEFDMLQKTEVLGITLHKFLEIECA